MTDTQELLSQVDLFQGLSGRALKRVVKAAHEIKHQDGHVVAAEGKGGLAFHLILTGEAQVTLGSSVRRTLGVGDYFGEISMIDGRPRSATVTAGAGLTTLAITHQEFTSLVEDEPSVSRGLLVKLCERLREAETASA